MGDLRIVVRKEALSFIEKTAEWYDYTMGRKAALHFVTGIYETINRLAKFPDIGTLDERRSTEKVKYYSFPKTTSSHLRFQSATSIDYCRTAEVVNDLVENFKL